MTKISTHHRKGAYSSRNGRTKYEKGYRKYTMEGKNPLKVKKLKSKNAIKKPKKFNPPTLGDIWPQS